MIGKDKKTIITFAEELILRIEAKDIEWYLSEMKNAVENNRYRIDRNSKRQDNMDYILF